MDGDSAIPPYAWIAWQLRDAIRAGVRGLGESMPSESELAELYGVSRMTAGKVLGLLAAEGLIRRRRGSGSVVARQISWEQIPAKTRDDHQRAPAHGQRARGRGRRRVRPADQHQETRLRRKALCGRCRYRGGNRPVGPIGRARLTAAHRPVHLTRPDFPVPAVLVLFTRIARLSGFAQSAGPTTAWKYISGLVFPQYRLVVRVSLI